MTIRRDCNGGQAAIRLRAWDIADTSLSVLQANDARLPRLSHGDHKQIVELTLADRWRRCAEGGDNLWNSVAVAGDNDYIAKRPRQNLPRECGRRRRDLRLEAKQRGKRSRRLLSAIEGGGENRRHPRRPGDVGERLGPRAAPGIQRWIDGAWMQVDVRVPYQQDRDHASPSCIALVLACLSHRAQIPARFRRPRSFRREGARMSFVPAPKSWYRPAGTADQALLQQPAVRNGDLRMPESSPRRKAGSMP